MQVFDEKRCYRTDEIAVLLGTAISTVYRMIRNIEEPLRAFRLKTNGQLRVHGKDLNQYLIKHQVDPVNE